MSDELKKMSLLDIFGQTAETLAQAEEKNKQEQGRSPIERYRISEDGDYSIRILPIAPDVVKNDKGEIIEVKPLERLGYEYPLKQLFLSIVLPKKKGKKEKKISVPVIKSNDPSVGLSDDLVSTYVRIAKEMYADDDELIKKITGSSFGGGLKFNNQRAMYVLDMKEKNPKPLLFQCPFSLYHEIDGKRIRLWKEMLEENEKQGCPISSVSDAFPLNINRDTVNGKTAYTTDIGRKKFNLTEEIMQALLDAPRIPDIIYHFSRYQLEAEKVALEQYDEVNDMEVTKDKEFIDCYNKLMAELPKDDTSHFDLASASNDNDSEGEGEVTIDSLFKEYDAMSDREISSNSDEYKDFREKIRQFVEDNNVDVRLSRSMNNLEMLEAIDEAMEADKKNAKKAAKAEKKEEEPEKKVEKEETKGSEDEERPARRVRHSRPVDDDEEEKKDGEDEPEKKAEESNEDDKETPVEEIMPRRRPRRR